MVEISPDAAEAIAASAPVSKDPKKKMSIWAKIFAVIVIISMTGWIFAAYLDNPDNQNNGNKKYEGGFEISGYTFYDLQDGTFGTFIGSGSEEIPIAFRLDPRNASNISLADDSVARILAATKAYVVVNPNNQTELAKIAVAAAEISRILPLYNITTVGAYTEDSNPPNPNVPIKTCDDATNTTAVIHLKIDPDGRTEIKTVDNCVHVIGTTADDLILAADKLGYNLVGITI